MEWRERSGWVRRRRRRREEPYKRISLAVYLSWRCAFNIKIQWWVSFRVGNNVVVIIIENIRRKGEEKAKNGWNLHHWLCRFCSSSVRREKENFCWFRSFHWGHIRRMKFYIFIASPNLFTSSLPSFLRPFLYPLTFDLEPINNDVIQKRLYYISVTSSRWSESEVDENAWKRCSSNLVKTRL